jgi:hypothetical protein
MPSPEGSAPFTGEERRSCERYQCSLEIPLRPLTGEDLRRWACVQDISRGGIRLLLSSRFPDGTMLLFELPNTAGGAQPLVGRVVHTHTLGQKNWALGCAFERGLDEEMLRRARG